ncbi:MAG: Glutamyl-tRNA reductase [Syntrophorhabdus sp. PtaU1.Bin050]|nr:MAG: Glutamyl-tRNA reductase [Syntrophorhabdus sp. PtaU1.Bin050]
MPIVVFGLNHNTAPLDVREKLYVPETAVPDLVREFKEEDIGEAVILSTCNRTEFYFSCDDFERSFKKFYRLLVEHFGLKPEWLEQYTYVFRDEDTYRHLFLVASGLDSMVMGEPQILGQVKDAYRLATDNSATGFLLDKVFHRTFNVAKRVRTETRIGYNPVSISSMATELAKKIFGELKEKKILVVGVGEMCEIALKNFKKEGVGEIFITNRTFRNAQALAENIAGMPRPFDDLTNLLTTVDMVLTSTGSEKPLIDTNLVSGVMRKRKYKPLFLIDIAVPRDVESAVNDVTNVYLYDIDDLKNLSQHHLKDRLKESERAHAIVEEEVARFATWIQQLDTNPLISKIYEKVEEMRGKELKKALQKLKDVDEETTRSIDILTKGIVNKLVHPHVTLIRQNGSPTVLEIMKKVFRIEEEDEKDMDNRHKG